MKIDFEETKVLVCGDIVLDKYTTGIVHRISPEAPVPVLRVSDEFYRLGGAANVAANIMALSGKANLFGFVGNDQAGLSVREMCEQKGIEFYPTYCKKTIIKNRFLTDIQQLLRVDYENIPNVKELLELHPKIENLLNETTNDSQIIIISDYGKGVVNRHLVEKLLKRKLFTIVDPIPQNAMSYLGVNVIKPNQKEAFEMCRFLGLVDGLKDPVSAMKELQNFYDGSDIVITTGETGMFVGEAGSTPYYVDTERREVYDVTGAGDTVTATLAMCMANGMNLREACSIANIAGGLVVGHLGSSFVCKEDLEENLNGKTSI